MAHVRPFRAVRYDEQRAGPLASLVAPPYDVLDAAARARYLAASPYNVVHLTLADDETEAAALWSALARRGHPRARGRGRSAGGSHRTTSGLTASRGRGRASSARCAPSRTTPESSCRTSARMRARRRGAFACSALYGRRSSRSSSSTTGGSNALPEKACSRSSSKACAAGCGGSTRRSARRPCRRAAR